MTIKALLYRESLLRFKRLSDVLNPLLFLTLVVILFPLAITPEIKLLRAMAPGIIWVSVLLATFLTMDNVFREDAADGSLEQLLINPMPLSVLVFIKISVSWLFSTLPLLLLTPLFWVMLHLNAPEAGVLVLSLLLATPTLHFIGAIGAALTFGVPNSSALLALLILPLFIPILIFAGGSLAHAQQGLSIDSQLTLLAAALIFTLPLASIVTAAILRIRVMG